MNTASTKPHLSLKPVFKSSPELVKACEKLVEAFEGLFEQQEVIKAAKRTLEFHAQKLQLKKEEIKTLVTLCRQRAKSQAEGEPGDGAQQWLFDLEDEKKRAEKLILYLPRYHREELQ